MAAPVRKQNCIGAYNIACRIEKPVGFRTRSEINVY